MPRTWRQETTDSALSSSWSWSPTICITTQKLTDLDWAMLKSAKGARFWQLSASAPDDSVGAGNTFVTVQAVIEEGQRRCDTAESCCLEAGWYCAREVALINTCTLFDPSPTFSSPRCNWTIEHYEKMERPRIKWNPKSYLDPKPGSSTLMCERSILLIFE